MGHNVNTVLKKSGQNINPIKSLLGTKKGKMIVGAIVMGVAIIVITSQLTTLTGNATFQEIGILAGIITMVLPIMMIQMAEKRRQDSIDSNLPIFLLALISSVQSGASLLRAVESAADREMGSLTFELKNLRANISWGMPIDESFDNFVNRVNTKLARRVGTLLQISMNIGGDVVASLELVQHHVSEMQNIEKERKSQLQPYIFTIYISFLVFIVVTILLVDQFFTEIEVVQDQLKEIAEEREVPQGMFGSLLGVSVSELNDIMFQMTLIEAIFGGLAAGKIGESSFVAGIKHIIVMIVITVIAFSFIGTL